MVLYNPVLPVVNGGYGAGQARLLPIHIWQITAQIAVEALREAYIAVVEDFNN
jgi:hypothetical protein